MMRHVFRRLALVAVLALGTFLVGARTASAQHVISGSGANLYRNTYTLAAGEIMQFQTFNCSGAEDTAMFLLRGTGAVRSTAAFNDDQGSSFTEPLCSYIFYTNNTGAAQTFELLITVPPGKAQALISFRTWRASTGWINEKLDFNVNGVTAKFSQSGGATHETVGRRSGDGGGPVDTVLYLIDTNAGGVVNYDDDNGPQRLSRMSVTMNTCSNVTWNCWTVAGNFSYASLSRTFDVWGKTGADGDGDGVPDAIETAKGTSPTVTDTDIDGMTDAEEFGGVSAASLTGGDLSLVMPWQHTGANPIVDDLFIEVDYMQAAGHDHNPLLASNWSDIQAHMTTIFSSDVAWTARNVVPHVMVDQGFTEVARVGFAACAGAGYLNFYDRKGNVANFDPLRASIFHYVIIGHALRSTACVDSNASGQAEIWGNDVLITLGTALNGVGSTNAQRGTFIHELGHNLGLVHNGNGSNSGANSCIHTSPMNYRYQLGSNVAGQGGLRAFSYSRGSCDNSGLGTCTNTCTARCVPSTQTSPKAGCNPNSGTCDCDLREWVTLSLDIPASGQMGYVGCQLSGSCAGVDPNFGNQAHAANLRSFFLGDHRENATLQRAFAAERRRLLANRGIQEHVDFEVEPRTGRTYSIE